jgi:hypothetical protein
LQYNIAIQCKSNNSILSERVKGLLSNCNVVCVSFLCNNHRNSRYTNCCRVYCVFLCVELCGIFVFILHFLTHSHMLPRSQCFTSHNSFIYSSRQVAGQGTRSGPTCSPTCSKMSGLALGERRGVVLCGVVWCGVAGHCICLTVCTRFQVLLCFLAAELN